MKIRHACAHRKPADLRIVPGDRERNRRAEDDAKVKSIVGVLPQVVCVDYHVSPESLLEPAVKLVSLSAANRSWGSQYAGEDTCRIPETSDDQVFVEGSFQNPGVGNPQHGIRRLDVIGDAQSRLCLPVAAEAAIDIPAHAQVERPVSCRDRVLNIQRHLLDVCMPMKAE